MSLDTFLSSTTGKKIVFTNGCFDILHRGHIEYLNQARAQGDILIVGINSDQSVARLKGPNRPVNNENDRTYLLENLKSVDHVEIFNEDTPLELIKRVQPDILVKDGDWKVEDIVGHEIVTAKGGEVKSLTFVDGHSTTSFIEKLQGKK